MCAVGVRETALLEACGGTTLFDFFDECAEAGSFGREEEDEAEAKRVA